MEAMKKRNWELEALVKYDPERLEAAAVSEFVAEVRFLLLTMVERGEGTVEDFFALLEARSQERAGDRSTKRRRTNLRKLRGAKRKAVSPAPRRPIDE